MSRRRDQLITPEAVALDLDLAGLGSRAVAQIIDGVILGAGAAVVLIVAAVVEGSVGGGGTILIGAVLGLLLLQIVYFLLFELLWDGQTPGKRSQSLRVVTLDGQPLTGTRAVVRNVLRLVDNLFIGAVGAVSIMLTRDSQRLGDLAGGTVVVHDRTGEPVAPLPPTQAAAWAEHLDVSAVDERQYALARQFLRRRDDLHPTARIQVGREVSGSLRDVVPGVPAAADDEVVIESILSVIRSRNTRPGPW